MNAPQKKPWIYIPNSIARPCQYLCIGALFALIANHTTDWNAEYVAQIEAENQATLIEWGVAYITEGRE